MRVAEVVLAVLLGLAASTAVNADKCYVPIDLVFALDASGSVETSGFQQTKDFVKDIVNGFDIGVKDTHVGVLTFSEIGEVQIGLTDAFDKATLFDKIDNLKYTGYRTNTNDALEIVGRDMFSLSGGTRQGVTKVLILLTDGKCTLCGNKGVKAAATKLKDEGVTVFTIGVTDIVNREELEDISSDPSERYMFFAKDFSELKIAVSGLQQKSCTVKKGKCMKPPRNLVCSSREEKAPCGTDDDCGSIQKCCFDGCVRTCTYPLLHCLTAIDVAFAIDSSSSVRAEGFERAKSFASRIAESFAISQTEARFATLTYSKEAEVQFKFERYDTAEQVKYALGQLPHYRSDTRIDKALEVAKSDLFSLNGKVRTRRPMVLVVFYDGDKSRDMPDLEALAAPLKNYGVKIVAISVGPEPNLYQIEKIASSNDMIYNAKNFTTLMPKLFNIAKETCNKKFGKCSPDPNPIKPEDCGIVENDCQNDFDCFGYSKCCRRGCKNVCVKPDNMCLRKMDLAFAVHNNLERGEFSTVKYYLKNVVDQFNIGEQNTHVAMMRWGGEPQATVEFDFNSDQASNAVIKKKIDNMRYQKGTAPLEKMLVKACDDIFCRAGGTRADYYKMMVIVTGPLPASDDNILQERVKVLRRKGVNVLVVGVGNVNTDTLQRITSDKRSTVNRVLLARDYAGIVQYVKDIPDFGCSEEAMSPDEIKEEAKDTCNKPTSCVKGEKGTRGRTGEVGKTGFAGDRGPPGPVGMMGPKGKRGVDGGPGPKGERGDEGMRGLPGFAGYNGIPGVPGEFGPTGVDGGCGLPGKSGSTGDHGLNGFGGPTGIRGALGYKGYKGLPAKVDPNMKIFPGDKGVRGEKAPEGIKGQKGEEGNLVFDGDLGPAGTKGLRGDQGDMGDYGRFKTVKGEPGKGGPPGPKGSSGNFESRDQPRIPGEKGESGGPGPKGYEGQRGLKSTDNGRKGFTGDQGPQGLEGYPGSPGEKGKSGVQGENGFKGEKGIRGIQGSTGKQGQTGQKGEVGPMGIAGQKGLNGEEAESIPGDAGSPGLAGEDGFPGVQGPRGAAGKKGEKGKEGAIVMGPPGDPGKIGARGFPGQDGLPGIVGMEGGRGPKGAKGDPGAIGDQGRHAKGIPGPRGKDGEPGRDGQAGSIGNIGPPGVKGDPVVVDCNEGTCPKGEKGVRGAPGNAGADGADGPRGPDGLKGNRGGPCPFCPPGSDGDSGEPGNPGLIGKTGEKGLPGDAGDSGTKGKRGAVGPPGLVGIRGEKGQPGDVGSVGQAGTPSSGKTFAPKGIKGTPGADGVDGRSGPTGAKGRKGESGPAGPQGSRGLRGAKGVSSDIGPKGFAGTPGTPGLPGDKGEDVGGEPGAPGNMGSQGRQGPIGEGGIKGFKGPKGAAPSPAQLKEIEVLKENNAGDPGIRGNPGVTGFKGELGDRGATGPNGETGPVGPKGFGGKKGEPGTQGPAGFKGDIGQAGFPGRNGQQGPPGTNGKLGPRGEAPRGFKGEPGLPGINGRAGKDAAASMGCVDFGDPTDIAFIVDSSRSVTEEDFQRQKEFIKNFLKRFPIGAGQTQAGIIKYGRKANIEIQFNEYTTEGELDNAINAVQHNLAQESRLDLAFRLARDQLFTAQSGSRGQRANKALVVLGDGFISGQGVNKAVLVQNALQYAEDLKLEGVTIFALGVGAERNKLLLQEIVSDSSYYLEIESYSDLLTRIYEVQNDLQDTCIYVGDPGRDGLPGQPGEPGDAGEPGKDGGRPAGPNGLQGPKGFRGEPGRGLPGDPGVKGIVGLLGQKGRAGTPGRDMFGPIGQKGQKGQTSDILVGPKGERGDQGFRGPTGHKSQALCDNVLATDIVFVIDTSSSVTHENFHKMKDFVSNIVRNFDVDAQLTRVSVVTFDERADLQIPLSRHNSERTLLENIDRLRYGNGEQTRTQMGLDLAWTQAFSELNGGRPGFNKALVFMTDGQTTYVPNGKNLKESVKPLRDAGVRRYAIGIGREISTSELNTIADDNIVFADSFDDLGLKISDQIEIIGKRGCVGNSGPIGRPGADGVDGRNGGRGRPGFQGSRGEQGILGLKGFKGDRGSSSGSGTKGEPGAKGAEGPRGLPGCEQGPDEIKQEVVTDIAFLLDASASLFEDGFQREKDFVKTVIDKIGKITYLGTHVGIISYSDEATIRISFNDHYNNYDLANAIDNIPYDSKSTRIDLGFQAAKKMFSEEHNHGGRGSSKKVLILLTDGQQTYVPRITEPSIVAKELMADGVDIFAVGIGSEIDRNELEGFISKPEFIFLAPQIEKLVSAVRDEVVVALKCEGGPRGEPGIPGPVGPPGPNGPAGPLGQKGYKGGNGEAGYGPTGEPGVPGKTGIVGIKGDFGFRGPEGAPGQQGLRGLKGFPGVFGQKGEPGQGGFIGNPGFPGLSGVKGERGDSIGPGSDGVRGAAGDAGLRGPPGDAGKLPPGNVIEDYTGPKGDMGPPGFKGAPGPPGEIYIAPGPPGNRGPMGDEGDIGNFGPRAQRGDAGKDGAKGSRGNLGSQGESGIPGQPGPRGPDGLAGEKGGIGRTRSGERGNPGIPGDKGRPGSIGIIGYDGFIGMPGLRGDEGEKGLKGISPTPVHALNPKTGKRGPDGEKGETGPNGQKGAAAPPMPGPAFEKGQPGETGPKGYRGLAGEQGDGFPGFDGEKGAPGFRGFKGYSGDIGPAGPAGKMGKIIGAEPGDIGALGRPAPKAAKGEPGIVGIKGLPGLKGRPGAKGERGQNGFTGLQGSQGPPGDIGGKGDRGDPGFIGGAGTPGPEGPSGVAEGFHIVVHSQSESVPPCPNNYKKMWDGFSLLYTVGNGKSHAQDLGDPGSCMKSFSTMPFLFCDIFKSCKYASRNDFVYWLSGSVEQKMRPVSNTAISPFISRCAVCEVPNIHIAVHSQSTEKPTCPKGWDPLWRGYSFMMVAGAGKTGAGQSLSSAGSCLQEFRPKPFIECQGARGTCHFFSDKFSFWLTTIDETKMFTTQTPNTLVKGRDDLKSRVSRCRVCIRNKGTIIDGDKPEVNKISPIGGNDGARDQRDLVTRIRKNINSIFGGRSQ